MKHFRQRKRLNSSRAKHTKPYDRAAVPEATAATPGKAHLRITVPCLLLTFAILGGTAPLGKRYNSRSLPFAKINSRLSRPSFDAHACLLTYAKRGDTPH